MATQLKSAAPTPAGTTSPEVTATVSGIIADIRQRGRRRRARVLGTFDRWSPPSFRLDADDVERIVATRARQVDRRHRDRAGATCAASPRPSATRCVDFEVETAARRPPRPEAPADRRRRRLRPRRALPAHRVGAHDDRDRQGRRRASASPRARRRSAARSRPPPSRPCTSPAPTRSTSSAACRRSRRWRSAPRRSSRST